MRRMDVQGTVRRILADALAPVEVRVNVPAEFPAELVTVRQKDGAAERRVYTDTTLEVQCWAESEERAYGLMDAVCERLSLLKFADGFADVTEKTVRSDRDLLRMRPRWYALFSLKTYRPPES